MMNTKHQENLHLVRECIKQNGPIRSDDVAKMTGVAISSVRSIIKNNRKDMKGDIYIGEWGIGIGRQTKSFYGKYCIGNKLDAEKPVRGSESGDMIFNDRARKKALANRPDHDSLMSALFQHVWGVNV